MVAINTTNEMAVVLEYLTYNVTGDMFLSLLFFMLIVMGLALAFRIPIEWTAVIIFPLLLGLLAVTGQFLPVIGGFIFFIAVLIAKNWLYGG